MNVEDITGDPGGSNPPKSIGGPSPAELGLAEDEEDEIGDPSCTRWCANAVLSDLSFPELETVTGAEAILENVLADAENGDILIFSSWMGMEGPGENCAGCGEECCMVRVDVAYGERDDNVTRCWRSDILVDNVVRPH